MWPTKWRTLTSDPDSVWESIGLLTKTHQTSLKETEKNTLMPLLQFHLLWPPCDTWHLPRSPAMPLQPSCYLDSISKQSMHAGGRETLSNNLSFSKDNFAFSVFIVSGLLRCTSCLLSFFFTLLKVLCIYRNIFNSLYIHWYRLPHLSRAWPSTLNLCFCSTSLSISKRLLPPL